MARAERTEARDGRQVFMGLGWDGVETNGGLCGLVLTVETIAETRVGVIACATVERAEHVQIIQLCSLEIVFVGVHLLAKQSTGKRPFCNSGFTGLAWGISTSPRDD